MDSLFWLYLGIVTIYTIYIKNGFTLLEYETKDRIEKIEIELYNTTKRLESQLDEMTTKNVGDFFINQGSIKKHKIK